MTKQTFRRSVKARVHIMIKFGLIEFQDFILKRLLVVGTVIVMVVGFVVPTLSQSASAAVTTLSNIKGFDTCAAPSTSTMDTWWLNSPYYWVGIYVGGVNRGCSQPNLTSSWVTHVISGGWQIVPIWAGLQDPCWSVALRSSRRIRRLHLAKARARQVLP